MNNELQEYLSECFDYDEETGDLTWKEWKAKTIR